MGKSNPHVFSFYLSNLKKQKRKSVGIFGQEADNSFTSSIASDEKDFYDLSLDNWDINNFPYNISKKYDLIVCTRCAYFCKNPEKMMEEFYQMLNPDGEIFIDWGLGDHWRFSDYKVGWVKNNEQEHAYKENNFLWSTVWDDSFLEYPEYKAFESCVKRYGYEDVKTAIDLEVPSILDLEQYKDVKVKMLALWPESPQLYILCQFRKSK